MQFANYIFWVSHFLKCIRRFKVSQGASLRLYIQQDVAKAQCNQHECLQSFPYCLSRKEHRFWGFHGLLSFPIFERVQEKSGNCRNSPKYFRCSKELTAPESFHDWSTHDNYWSTNEETLCEIVANLRTLTWWESVSALLIYLSSAIWADVPTFAIISGLVCFAL